MPAAVETMVSARQVPWHGLGVVVDDVMTAEECLIKSGLNWNVEKKAWELDGHVSEEFFALRRDSDQKVLGTVGRPYVPLQNRDAFAFADSLVDSDEAKYETAGSLRGGKWIWLAMKIPQGVTIGNGDEINSYLLLFNSHDGSKAITAAVTPVRVVCMNTLNLALRNHSQSWTVRHVSTMDGKMAEARRALELSFEYLGEFEELGNQLVQESFTERQFRNLAEKVAENDKQNEGLITTFTSSPTIEEIRFTKWGALNAVGEYYDWTREPQNENSRVMGSLMGVGRRARNKALTLITT
jgi:phage/plasmid-like protein (TIGR03299 family)